MISEKQIPLKNVIGMDYEPRNEAGVIILFALLMKRLNFSRVVEAQENFPDCIARRQGQRVSIEFEYKSKTFITHVEDGTWRMGRSSQYAQYPL